MLEKPYKRVIGARPFTRLVYYVWIALPYPIRKPVTALALTYILTMKKLFGVNRRNEPTPMERMGTLSFWGVPQLSEERYRLRVSGEVDNPLELSLDEIVAMPSVEPMVRMDCVGGFRNNSTMKGVRWTELLAMAAVRPKAGSALFRCSDEYYTTHLLSDLEAASALLVYEVNGERVQHLGSPLRLAVPGTYGYKWAKWVTEIELVTGFPPGYWEGRGLPKRGRVGDVW